MSADLRPANAPVRMKLRGFRTEEGGWGTFSDRTPARANEPPRSPIAATGRAEEITLIPYGSTAIRIALFPWAKE